MKSDQFLKKSPREIAHELEKLSPEEIVSFLQKAKPAKAQDIFFELCHFVIADIYPFLDEDMFVKIFSKSDTHRAARVLSNLNREDVNKKLELLPKITSLEIIDFLEYGENTAGFLMETLIATYSREDTVESALIKLRKIGNKRILTIYIVDSEDKLIGRVPVNYLAIANPQQQLGELMYKAYSVQAMATRDEVLEAIELHSLLQMPVVDINNYLLGVIRNDILVQTSREEFSDDMQMMFGAGKEEHALSKASFAVKKRLPWLQINLVTAFLASVIVGLFEDTIAQITVLAVFLPVVAGQSGNTGSQALAVTIRGLALKEIRIGQWFQVAKKELVAGLINGIAVAATTSVVVYFWTNSMGIAIVIGISMIISMIIAGFSGAVIPIGLKAIGQDPATSSSIILTTVTDICGFLSFLGLATALSKALDIV